MSKDRESKINDKLAEAIKKKPLEQRIQLGQIFKFYKLKKTLDDEKNNKIDDFTNSQRSKLLPIITNINKVISGTFDFSDELICHIEKYLTAEQKEKFAQERDAFKKPIEKYWVTAMKNCQLLTNDIVDKDAKALESLKEIKCEFVEGKRDFKLIFDFEDNEFFDKCTLIKECIFEGEDPIKCNGSDIPWKQGKNLTKKQEKKKQKNKKSGQVRYITKEVDTDSFFNFFKTLDTTKEGTADLDEDEVDEMKEQLEDTCELANIVLEDIVLCSLEYYLKIKKSEEDGDYDDLDDIEEEDEDDSDSEDDLPKRKSSKNKAKDNKKGKKKKSEDNKEQPGATEEKPECKQQ